LGLAARQADTVGIIAQSAKAGGIDFGRDTDAVVAEKVGWVREAAGERFAQLELAPVTSKRSLRWWPNWPVAEPPYQRVGVAAIPSE